MDAERIAAYNTRLAPLPVVCLPENGPIKNRKKTLFLINNYENNTIYSNTQLNRQTNDIIKTT